MVYVYTSTYGGKEVATREEAIKIMNENKVRETSMQIKQNPYIAYKDQYEAILLYIIKAGNDKYPEYMTRKKVGQIFTLSMIRWYLQTDSTYTGEKPIYCGRIKHYHDNVGFPAFDLYYSAVKQDIRGRENEKGWYVVFTEIPCELLEGLVKPKMQQIIRGAVRDCQYKKESERKINQAFKQLRKQLGGKYILKGSGH